MAIRENKYRRLPFLKMFNFELVLASFDIYRENDGEFTINNMQLRMREDCHSIKTVSGKTITSAIDLVQYVCNLDSREGFETAYNYLDKLNEKALKRKVQENNRKISDDKQTLY